jgi:probable F420-dependent oxidoreductase
MYEQYGTYGAWLNPSLGDADRIDCAPELEDLGFQTIWMGIGPDPVGEMKLMEQTLAETRTATVATAIINMWQDTPESVAHQYHRIVDRFGPRLLLGLGLGHPESRSSYDRPYHRMVSYLDTLRSSGVPDEAVVIGALGPKTLRLAGERTLGAHPYLTVPEHTSYAREVMGANAFLAPEHKVVLTEDPEEARTIGRPAVQFPYLGLRNYTNNLVRHGFTDDDVAGSGSDRLIDALVLRGSPHAIYRRLDEHLDNGANHVGIQVLTTNPDRSPMPAYRALAHSRPPRGGAHHRGADR